MCGVGYGQRPGHSNATTPATTRVCGKQVPSRVKHAFQALALDENRPKFKPCVWESKEPEEKNANAGSGTGGASMSQVWFRGSHGDVGGTADAGLGALTLL